MNAEIEVLLKKVVTGDAIAQYELGKRYEEGRDIARDYSKAREWYAKSAARGCADGQFKMALDCGLQTPPNLRLQAEWYGKAAALGHAGARNNIFNCYCELARSYEFGINLPKNLKLAVEWYAKAGSQIDLARCHEKGIGVPVDLKMAKG